MRVGGRTMDMAMVGSGYEEVEEQGRQVTLVVEDYLLGSGGEESGYQKDLALGVGTAVEGEEEDAVVEDGKVWCYRLLLKVEKFDTLCICA